MRTILVAAALLGGCAANTGDTTLEVTFDVCEPIAVVPPSGATAGELDGIDGALAMWRAQRDWPIARADGGATRAASAAIEVVFESAAHPFHGLYDDQTGVVYINTDLADAERSIAIAHELGHAFGLLHVTDRESIMNPGNLSIAPTEADAAEVDSIWGPCAPAAP